MELDILLPLKYETEFISVPTAGLWMVQPILEKQDYIFFAGHEKTGRA